jgi:hypothetical protein
MLYSRSGRKIGLLQFSYALRLRDIYTKLCFLVAAKYGES